VTERGARRIPDSPSNSGRPVDAAFRPSWAGVVVPARDEAELLPACLRSLAVAAGHCPVPVRIVVALDRCADGSDRVVEALARDGVPVRAVAAELPGVGAARAAGVRALLAEAGAAGVPVGEVWLATTDADSEVPPHWLAHQLGHAARGARAVVGTVRVGDWSPQPPGVAERYARRYRAEHGHRHLHGANLGFTASSYLGVGGFAELASDEDVDLVTRLADAGTELVWVADLAVTTSARRVGRAPAGFAQHLAELATCGTEQEQEAFDVG